MKIFLKVLLWVVLVVIVVIVVMALAIVISGEFSSFGDLFEYLFTRYDEGDGILRIISPFVRM